MGKHPHKLKLHLSKRKKHHINRKYKDSLFQMLFHNKKDLLDLYNAINGTDYHDVDDLTYYTLEDAIYMSFKNDVSFLLSEVLNLSEHEGLTDSSMQAEVLNLYEHQSTINPNMPIRGLLYFARDYEAYIENNHINIYSSVLQKLPVPQYIVFYNGSANAEEKQVMELKDAFPEIPGLEPCLNCKVTMLNINYGHNMEILNRCRKLKEYAQFIHQIRVNLTNGMDKENAIHEAITFCIREHVLENFLTKHLAEVESMVLTSFNQKDYEKMMKKEYEMIGEKRGLEKGFMSLLRNQVTKKLQKGNSISEIAQALEQDEEIIRQIVDELNADND